MKIFLATSLEKQREDELGLVLAVRTALNAEYGPDAVFLAAYEYPTPDTYLPPRESLDVVLETLRASDVFVLYFPRKVFSGALMELAWALSWSKPCLIITETVESLPYMVREGAPGMEIACIANGLDISAAEASKYASAIRAFVTKCSQSL
jgi:hypothetical protein